MKSEREIQVYETNSPDETYEIGKQMAQKAEAGTVFCLEISVWEKPYLHRDLQPDLELKNR